jgi:hypothetical protein
VESDRHAAFAKARSRTRATASGTACRAAREERATGTAFTFRVGPASRCTARGMSRWTTAAVRWQSMSKTCSTTLATRQGPRAGPAQSLVSGRILLEEQRECDAEVALFQDCTELLREADLITDDSPFGQWYVGNWPSPLALATSTTTVYVDDATVRLP